MGHTVWISNEPLSHPGKCFYRTHTKKLLNPLKPETYCIVVYHTSQPAHESKVRYFGCFLQNITQGFFTLLQKSTLSSDWV